MTEKIYYAIVGNVVLKVLGTVDVISPELEFLTWHTEDGEPEISIHFSESAFEAYQMLIKRSERAIDYAETAISNIRNREAAENEMS